MPECILTESDWDDYFEIEAREKLRQKKLLEKRIIKKQKKQEHDNKKYTVWQKEKSFTLIAFRIFMKKLDGSGEFYFKSIKECVWCSFTTRSQAGLTIHAKNKHGTIGTVLSKQLVNFNMKSNAKRLLTGVKQELGNVSQ